MRILSLLILFPLYIFAQNNLQSKADALFDIGYFYEANELYEKLLLTGRGNEEIVKKALVCKNAMDQFEEAEKMVSWWQKNKKSGNDLILSHAILLAKLEKYQQSKSRVEKYLSSKPLDSLAINLLASCNLALSLLESNSEFTIKPLKNVNSPSSDFAPVTYKEDLVFCSTREGTIIRDKSQRDGEPFSDLYISYVKNDSWTSPVPFSFSINTGLHEGPASFNSNFDTIYFSRNGEKSNNSHLKLYSASAQNGKWKEPSNFMMNDSTFSFAHPCISDDGKLFFFVSDLPSGYGGTDIYVCIKIDSNWSFPINLGPSINTSGNELFPNYNREGNLFFTSDGHPGVGGLDIFVAHQQNGEWMKPKNLGLPINSGADDSAFHYVGSKKCYGYFSSNRTGGEGRDDIYMAEKK